MDWTVLHIRVIFGTSNSDKIFIYWWYLLQRQPFSRNEFPCSCTVSDFECKCRVASHSSAACPVFTASRICSGRYDFVLFITHEGQMMLWFLCCIIVIWWTKSNIFIFSPTVLLTLCCMNYFFVAFRETS